MLRSEVLDERMSFHPRRITQPKRRRELSIDDDHAFEPANDRRQMLGAGNVLRGELAAAGDLNPTAGHRAAQSLTGSFADLRRLLGSQRLKLGLREDGSGQRML